MNKIDKLEADLQHVEEILNRTRSDLINLVPGDKVQAEEIALQATDESKPEKDKKSHAHGSRSGWFGFLTHKS